MRLDDARLCLDCEEIHEQQECPSCGSEAFAFLKRWIQSTNEERPARTVAKAAPAQPPAARPATREQLNAWRKIVAGESADSGRGRKIVGGSLLGLAAMGLAGWAWTRTGKKESQE